MEISALIPTITGREHWLERCVAALDKIGGVEIVVVHDKPNWGIAINEAAGQATGTYLFLGSDDMEVVSFGAAAHYCDRAYLPAPRVLNGDGTLQSCGEWATEQDEGSLYIFPRIPFLSRRQWQDFGPLLPIHYADPHLGVKALAAGVETVVCRSYEVVHHMAPEGRLDYDEQERIRLETEAA